MHRPRPAHLVLGAIVSVAVWLPVAPSSAQDTQTQTDTQQEPAPTTTTPEPAPVPEPTPEPEPEPTPPPSGPTSAPNEYVESVPQGFGSTPSSPQSNGSGTGTNVIPPVASTELQENADESAAGNKKNKKAADKKTRKRARNDEETGIATPPRPTVPAASTAADVGDGARLLWLGLALLTITGGILGTAAARRRRAEV